MMPFFAKNIQFLRKKRGITQAEMPTYIEVTRTTWGNYENNVSEPDITKLYEIAKLFGVTLDQLIGSDLTEDVNLNNFFSQHYKEQQTLNSKIHLTDPNQRKEDINKGNIAEILSKLNNMAENIELLKKGLL